MPRRLHGARHRHGVRQGARVRDRRDRPRHGPRRRAQAPGPVAHAVGDRRGHRGRRRQLRGRPPGGGGDGRVPADPGRDRHRGRAGQGLHDDAHPGAQEARGARSPTPSWSSSSTASSARRSRRRSGRSRGRPACRTSTSGSSTARSSARRSTATGCRTRSASRAATSGSGSSTRSRRWSTWARSSRSRASWTWSCWRSSPSRTPSPRVLGAEHVRQAGRAVRGRGRRHDGRRAGPPGRHRGHADVRARGPGVHEVDRGPAGPARSRAPRRSRWTTRGASRSSDHEAGRRRSCATTSPCGPPAWSW